MMVHWQTFTMNGFKREMVVCQIPLSLPADQCWQAHTHTHTTVLRLYGFFPGQPCWAGTGRNIHSLTPIVVINHPLSASSVYYDPLHPPCSIHAPDNLFPQSLSKFSLVYLLTWHAPLHTVHFFTQSLSSFRNTCPYHCILFCCSTKIMSSNPSLSLNPLLGILSCSFTPHIHLTILFSAHWSAY